MCTTTFDSQRLREIGSEWPESPISEDRTSAIHSEHPDVRRTGNDTNQDVAARSVHKIAAGSSGAVSDPYNTVDKARCRQCVAPCAIGKTTGAECLAENPSAALCIAGEIGSNDPNCAKADFICIAAHTSAGNVGYRLP